MRNYILTNIWHLDFQIHKLQFTSSNTANTDVSNMKHVKQHQHLNTEENVKNYVLINQNYAQCMNKNNVWEAKLSENNFLIRCALTVTKKTMWRAAKINKSFEILRVTRGHFVYVPSQWETTLHCNVVSHWLGACTKWALGYYSSSS